MYHLFNITAWHDIIGLSHWASTREKLSSVVYKQQMHRPACAFAQSDQCLCYLFLYPATKVWRGIMLYPSVSVRPSVRPCSPFPIDNLSIYSRNFFKFCIHIVIGKSGMGLLMGKIRSFLTELLPFFVLEKWFLACYSFTVHDI